MSCPLNDILVYTVQLYYLVTFKFCFHFSLDISTTPSLYSFTLLWAANHQNVKTTDTYHWFTNTLDMIKKNILRSTYLLFCVPPMITSGYLFVKPSGSSTHIPTMMRFLSNKLILEAICFVLVLTFSFPYIYGPDHLLTLKIYN